MVQIRVAFAPILSSPAGPRISFLSAGRLDRAVDVFAIRVEWYRTDGRTVAAEGPRTCSRGPHPCGFGLRAPRRLVQDSSPRLLAGSDAIGGSASLEARR